MTWWDRIGLLDGRINLRHTIYTVNGAAANMWMGPPADTARALGDRRWNWRPVPYASGVVPNQKETDNAIRTLTNMVNSKSGTFTLIGYSWGALICSDFYQNVLRDGLLKHRHDDLIGADMFGNPCREEDASFPGGKDPGGAGIAPASRRMKNTPSFWFEYCEPDDIYGSTDLNNTGEHMRAIFNMIFGDLISGDDDIGEQLIEIVGNPFGEGLAALIAMYNGIKFFGSGTASHIQYHTRQAIPGMTYLQHSINHMRALEIVPVRV